MPIRTRKPKPPIRCFQHDLLPPDRQRACWAQPIPTTPREQLAFLVAIALHDAARRERKTDPAVLRRNVIRSKASWYRVSHLTIRRHLHGRGPGPGHRLRCALRYDIEGLFCPIRRAEQAAQQARQREWDAKARAERAAQRAAGRERSRLYNEALERQFRDM